MAERWPVCPSLTSLAIGNTSMRTEPLMMSVPALRTLRINGCLSPRGCTAMPLSVAAAVAACRHLSEVCLPDCLMAARMRGRRRRPRGPPPALPLPV